MALTWTTPLIRPLALGGAARLLAAVVPDPGTRVERVVAAISLAPVTAWDDPSALAVELASRFTGRWEGTAFGALPAVVAVSFFALLDGAWVAGPVVTGVSLVPDFEVRFPDLKGWVLGRLREVMATLPPFPQGRSLALTLAYPRNAQGLPALNVQLDSVTPSSTVDADILGADAAVDAATGRATRGRLYSLNASLVGWCVTPEDRDRLSRLLIQAMEVVLDAARFTEFQEPSCSFEESEDFQTLEVPLFLVTARLTTSAWAELCVPLNRQYGR